METMGKRIGRQRNRKVKKATILRQMIEGITEVPETETENR